jgi:hypothetical protein
LDSNYISGLAALAGAAIGGMTSFATSWVTERAPLRNAQREAERARLEALYTAFIDEAARLFGDALTKQTDSVARLVQIYSMVGRMRLPSSREAVEAAVRVEDAIIEAYPGPNRTLTEVLDYAHEGGLDVLTGFGEACRRGLASKAVSSGCGLPRRA